MKANIPNSNAVKKVAIVDDHPMMREGLEQLVKAQPGFECCWAAGNLAQAIEYLERTKPDLLIADMKLPGRNGMELIKDALSIVPSLPILVISMYDETLYTQRVLKAGGKGYIMKDAPRLSLLEAISEVANGGIWISPEMSRKIIHAFSGKQKNEAGDGVHRLTDREFEVFQLIGEGRSKSEISESLNISPKTVDVHKSNIRDKLELKDAASVLRHAIRWLEIQEG
ncbi:MAG: response regulator [Akkermansiaceae bacterium]|jgi:DNA-binding NarL/FixJ family response regulator